MELFKFISIKLFLAADLPSPFMPSQKPNNAPITVPVAPNNNNNNINNNLKIGELETIGSRQLFPITIIEMKFTNRCHDLLAMCPTKQFTSFCDVVFRSLSTFDDFFVFTPENRGELSSLTRHVVAFQNGLQNLLIDR